MKKVETDVLIIGGGVTGAGILRDCSLRGISAVLVEKLAALGFVNSEKHYKVKYSDLDVVQHVNNTQYQRFILDTFSSGFRNEFHIKSFEINYLAEALIDDDLKILTGRSSKQYEYKHEIRRSADEKIICRAVSLWEKD